MTTIRVGDRVFLVEFRHKKKGGKRADLKRGPVRAVTTCVVMEMGTFIGHQQIKFIAIDNAICIDSDNFCRREGRFRALAKVLDHCTPLREIKVEFLVEYTRIDPEPVRQAKVKVKPTAEQIAKWREVAAQQKASAAR